MRRVRRGSCDLADFESVFCEIMTTEWQGKPEGPREIFANVYALRRSGGVSFAWC